jgi:hypothetical protein
LNLTDRTAAVNGMCCEIVSMLASSARGRRFDPKSGQTICISSSSILVNRYNIDKTKQARKSGHY